MGALTNAFCGRDDGDDGGGTFDVAADKAQRDEESARAAAIAAFTALPVPSDAEVVRFMAGYAVYQTLRGREPLRGDCVTSRFNARAEQVAFVPQKRPTFFGVAAYRPQGGTWVVRSVTGA